MKVTLDERTAKTVKIYYEQSQQPYIKATLPQKAQSLQEALDDYQKTLLPGAKSFGRIIKADGKYVGDIWCYCIDKQEDPNAMLSFCVFDKSYLNKGIATKAVSLFLREMREKYGIGNVGAFAYSDNHASLKVLEKSGFAFVESFIEDGRESKFYKYTFETENIKTENYRIIPFEEKHIDAVLNFEKELRRQEPDTYFREPDEEYRKALSSSFSDGRFINAISFIAVKDGDVIGRIDASIISSRSDAACCSAYLDWICVLKSERHNKVAQALLYALRKKLKAENVSLLIALMAQNDEAQRFYRSVQGASIHDEGIWIDI